MTRIIAGVAGGRRLRTPRGKATRPTADRVREALFSAIEAEAGTLRGRRFLDLYAGSGAVGLEARSRGATAVTVVERVARTAELIRANARALGLDHVTVVVSAAEQLAMRPPPGGSFDLVFLDPPYDTGSDRVALVLTALAEAGWLAASALVVIERARRGPSWEWPRGFEAVRARRYGETMLWYGRAVGAGP